MNVFSYNLNMRYLVTFVLLLLLITAASADLIGWDKVDDVKRNLRTIKIDGIEYVSLLDIAEFLQANTRFDLRRGEGKLIFENGELDFIQFSPYVIIGDHSYNIRHNVILRRAEFYAPVDFITPVIDRLLPDDLIYSASDNALGLFPARFNIIDLTAHQKLNGLLIEVFLTEDLKYDVVQTNDNWLVLTMYQGKIDTAAFSGKRPDIAVYDTKAYQFDNSAQVSIRLRPKEFTFVSKVKDDPLRIQILIKGAGFADTVLTYNPNGIDNKQNNIIDVVVIDPGHGGEDEGAIGPSGTKEKDINLKIAKELEDILIDKGLRVILTRDRDRFVPLSDRTKIANEAGADIFVSVHSNAAPNKKARGFISFFLSDAKSDQARAAAALENASIQFESTESQRDYVSDLDFILLDMVQSEFLKESMDLAAIIEQNIPKYTKIESRGIDQAGFFVLNKAYMPSVLVECAFISNRDDEKLLKDKKNQKQIAEAIAESISQFKTKYESVE